MLEGSFIRHYKIISILHPGTGGNIYIVEDTKSENGDKFVIKSSFLEQSKKDEIENMIIVWKDLSKKNDFIVKVFDFFYEKTNAFILMEFCEGGDLETLIKKRKSENSRFSEYEIVKIACDIFNGLGAIHAVKIIHRDIKPANILISKGVCKLADFNVSRILSDGNKTSFTFAGTLQYVPPEIFLNKGYSFSADVYSVGAVLYELITLTPAFPGMDIPAILANRYAPLDPALGYSAPLLQLVARLLSLDPSSRPSPEDALADDALADVHTQGLAEEQQSQSRAIAALQAQVDAQQGTIAALQSTAAQQAAAIASLQKTVGEQQAAMAQFAAALADQKKTVCEELRNALLHDLQQQPQQQRQTQTPQITPKKICPICRSTTIPRNCFRTTSCGKCGRLFQFTDWDHCDKCNKSFCNKVCFVLHCFAYLHMTHYPCACYVCGVYCHFFFI